MIRKKISVIFAIVFLNAYFTSLLFSGESKDFVYESKGKRDPFTPLVTKNTRLAAGLENIQSIDEIILEGIVWDPQGDSIAILNGVIVKEGQRIGNIRIKNIKERRIALFINEIEYKIDLIKEGDEKSEKE